MAFTDRSAKSVINFLKSRTAQCSRALSKLAVGRSVCGRLPGLQHRLQLAAGDPGPAEPAVHAVPSPAEGATDTALSRTGDYNSRCMNRKFRKLADDEVGNGSLTHVSGWFTGAYMRCMSQKFRLFQVSILSVLNIRIFMLMYPGYIPHRTELSAVCFYSSLGTELRGVLLQTVYISKIPIAYLRHKEKHFLN